MKRQGGRRDEAPATASQGDLSVRLRILCRSFALHRLPKLRGRVRANATAIAASR